MLQHHHHVLAFAASARDSLKCVHSELACSDSIGFGRREWHASMPQISYAATDQADSNDLISFLKAIPDGRFRRGVRYPQWFLLLVAVLGILSGCRSSRDLEAFAKRHREALNQALGLNFKCCPSDANFL